MLSDAVSDHRLREQRATADLQSVKGQAVEAGKLQREVTGLRSKLSSAKTELEFATNELKYVKKDKVAQDLLQSRLHAAKEAEQTHKSELERLKAELLAKEEQRKALLQLQSANTHVLQVLVSACKSKRKRERAHAEERADESGYAGWQEAGRALDGESHPTYGKLLVDLAYKRVFCANARTLFSQVPPRTPAYAYRATRSVFVLCYALQC